MKKMKIIIKEINLYSSNKTNEKKELTYKYLHNRFLFI